MYEAMRQFGQAYFHQDFDLDAPTPVGVVRRYAHRASRARREELGQEIESALGTLDAAGLENLWLDQCEAEYDPAEDGLTYREWFEKVLEVLREPA